MTAADRLAADILSDTDLLTPNHDGTPEHYTIAADDLPDLIREIASTIWYDAHTTGMDDARGATDSPTGVTPNPYEKEPA